MAAYNTQQRLKNKTKCLHEIRPENNYYCTQPKHNRRHRGQYNKMKIEMNNTIHCLIVFIGFVFCFPSYVFFVSMPQFTLIDEQIFIC